MRKTLHTLPLPLAAAAHAATLTFRNAGARRAVLNAGYTPAAIDRLISRLCLLLQDGPLPHRTIETRLAARGGVLAARLALKVAWERGTIAYINAATVWNRETRTFALTSSAYPTLDLSLTRRQAISELVTAYFDRYGPATVRDAAWWSGLPATDITTALYGCGRPVITVATPWSEDPCLMFADRAEEGPGDEAAATGVQFLAREDTALKAYHQTRDRYLAGLPQQRAFNQIGEALPTVIIDGIVVGTWSWDTRTASVRADMIRGRASEPVRRQVQARAAALTETFRSAWEPGPRSRHVTRGQEPSLSPPARPIALLPAWPAARVANPGLVPSSTRGDHRMEPLSQGASLPRIQDYVAKMEAERGLDKQDLPSQCLKLGEEIGELYRAVRKLQGQPQDPAGRAADIGDEAVDALILLMSIVNRCGINLEDAFRAKEARNESRVWI
jgi:NTP pyrophosphatase (non-canonical NTP hydrolase)